MAYTEGQVAGAIVALSVCVSLYLISLITPLVHPKASSIPFLTGRSSSIAVELAGDCRNNKGIYFLPDGTTVEHFLQGMSGRLLPEWLGNAGGLRLSRGISLLVCRSNGSRTRFLLNEMSATGKIALGLPVDINRASREDLMLIPGIGARTAGRIISLRESTGGIVRLEELQRVQGIKEKKFARLKKYFCVEAVRKN